MRHFHRQYLTGTKRCRDDEDFEDEQVAKVPAITSVGLKRGRSGSGSSSSSSSSSTSEQEDQKIDGEGDAVMHMKNFPEQHLTKEYRLSISTKEGMRDKQLTTRRDKPASGNREHVHEKDRIDQLVYDVVEIFSPPRVCRRARSRGLRGGWSLDDRQNMGLVQLTRTEKSLKFVFTRPSLSYLQRRCRSWYSQKLKWR